MNVANGDSGKAYLVLIGQISEEELDYHFGPFSALHDFWLITYYLFLLYLFPNIINKNES